ncbi:unnamed protein product [Rhodiola kirilowii]
MRRNKS